MVALCFCLGKRVLMLAFTVSFAIRSRNITPCYQEQIADIIVRYQEYIADEIINYQEKIADKLVTY